MTDIPNKQKRRYAKPILIALTVSAVVLLVAGELTARFYLGLGDPPLHLADPEIEYLFQPSQDVSRFGNRIQYNAHSMRSDLMPKEKTGNEVLRVLVLGDSIVNGGSLMDQSDLATQLLQAALTERLGGVVRVGNISAGSWGPGNLLAYIDRYGLFDTDAVVLVQSSHDANDVMTFDPLVGESPAFPDKKPVLALQEAVFRYLPRYLPDLKYSGPKTSDHTPDEQADESDAPVFGALPDLEALIKRVQADGVPLVLIQHPTQSETLDGYEPGYKAIADKADEFGVKRLDLLAYIRENTDKGEPVYRDFIHLNESGQEALARAIQDALAELLDWND